MHRAGKWTPVFSTSEIMSKTDSVAGARLLVKTTQRPADFGC